MNLAVVQNKAFDDNLKEYIDRFLAEPHELPSKYPEYIAFGQYGEFIRKARVISELPYEMRFFALNKARLRLALPSISFGVPIFVSLNMSATEVDQDRREFLKSTGADLPLHYFWKE
jgi:hypothetical protein